MDLYVFNSAGDRIELDKINNDQQGKRQLIYVCDTDKQEEVDELVSILITRADNIGLETNPVDLIGVYEYIKTNSNDTIPFSAFTGSLRAFVSDLEEEEDEYNETLG